HRPAQALRLGRRRRRRRQLDTCFEARWVELGVVGQDEPLESLELRARVETELVGEQPARRAVQLERVGLPTGAVEGEHEQGAKPFLERVRGYERLQLADELGVPPEIEIDLRPVEQSREARRVQPLGLAGGEALEAKVGERRPAPELERLAQALGLDRRLLGRPGLADEAIELERVE